MLGFRCLLRHISSQQGSGGLSHKPELSLRVLSIYEHIPSLSSWNMGVPSYISFACLQHSALQLLPLASLQSLLLVSKSAQRPISNNRTNVQGHGKTVFVRNQCYIRDTGRSVLQSVLGESKVIPVSKYTRKRSPQHQLVVHTLRGGMVEGYNYLSVGKQSTLM